MTSKLIFITLPSEMTCKEMLDFLAGKGIYPMTPDQIKEFFREKARKEGNKRRYLRRCERLSRR